MIEDINVAVQDAFTGIPVKIIVAVVILLIGFVAGKLIARIVYKILNSFEVNRSLKGLTGISFNVEGIVETFVKIFIYFIAVIIALQQLGIATTILNFVAAGVIIVIIIAVILGVKDFIPNTIAGLFIKNKKTIKVGETIKVKGMKGVVKEITLVETKIETKTGDIIFIPNSVISKTEVIKLKNKKKNSRKI